MSKENCSPNASSDLIDLNDSIDDLFTPIDIKLFVNPSTILPIDAAISKIQNEELNILNMPESPPFTKVSSIKMYNTITEDRKSKSPSVKPPPLNNSPLITEIHAKRPFKSHLPIRVKRKLETDD